MTYTEKNNQRLQAYNATKAAEAALRAATPAYEEPNFVDAHERSTGPVGAYYKGFGPKKLLPNLPQKRLYAYLTAHGVKAENLRKVYALFAYGDTPTTTHTLQAAGLLDTQDYFKALAKLKKGQRF